MDANRSRRALAAAILVAGALLGSACDKVGPPPQDIGFEHSVEPQKPASTAGRSRGTAGRRSARPTHRV
ncbi:hypothetical protein JOD65_004097 [Nocardioides cavernae]|nr:hypothetical protein [Nocardioides cavernae]